MYKEFQDKITFINGKYVYIAGTQDYLSARDQKVLPDGILLKYQTGKVLQVLENGEAIIHEEGYVAPRQHYGNDAEGVYDRIQSSLNSRPDLFFHIKGYKGTLVDGQSFNDIPLISSGTYKYINTSGAQKTIQSFTVYEFLTKEQFVDALNGGLVLMKRDKVGDKTIETPIP
jgi:hypothetical protein